MALSPKWSVFFTFTLLLCVVLHCNAQSGEEFPVLYKGRLRSKEAYARLWLQEVAHRQTLKRDDLELFRTHETSPLAFLWSLEFSGSSPFLKAPLFWIGPAEVKRLAGLPLMKDRFSYDELQSAAHLDHLSNDQNVGKEWSALLTSLKEFENIQTPSLLEEAFLSFA